MEFKKKKMELLNNLYKFLKTCIFECKSVSAFSRLKQPKNNIKKSISEVCSLRNGFFLFKISLPLGNGRFADFMKARGDYALIK